jgi:orotidine-5'-phosphate decarboxylase
MASPENMHNNPSPQEIDGQKKSHFVEMLENKWNEGKFVCVGLDSDYAKLPETIRAYWDIGNAIFEFNKGIVDATQDLVGAYKPNSAFYEAYGQSGISALRDTISYIKSVAPDVPVILDAKRADIGNTNDGYVKFAFDECRADAITVHPYLGREAMKPFLDRGDKGVIVLARTSNPGASEFQDFGEGTKLYERVAQNVSDEWNYNGNCGLVVGATYPGELQRVREIAPNLPILIPGIGAQGGDLERTLEFGKDSKNQGMIINSSRGIIFASKGEDFAEAARVETEKLHNQIGETLSQV